VNFGQATNICSFIGHLTTTCSLFQIIGQVLDRIPENEHDLHACPIIWKFWTCGVRLNQTDEGLIRLEAIKLLISVF